MAETIVSEYEPPMIVQLLPDCCSNEPEYHFDPEPPTSVCGSTACAAAGNAKATTKAAMRASAPTKRRYTRLADSGIFRSTTKRQARATAQTARAHPEAPPRLRADCRPRSA